MKRAGDNMAFFSFALTILAAYRLAHLLPKDEGPFFIFARIREFVEQKAIDEGRKWGKWHGIHEGINCPYCCGIYAAAFIVMLSIWNNFYGNLFVLIFAVAGAQSLLQRWGEK